LRKFLEQAQQTSLRLEKARPQEKAGGRVLKEEGTVVPCDSASCGRKKRSKPETSEKNGPKKKKNNDLHLEMLAASHKEEKDWEGRREKWMTDRPEQKNLD